MVTFAGLSSFDFFWVSARKKKWRKEEDKREGDKQKKFNYKQKKLQVWILFACTRNNCFFFLKNIFPQIVRIFKSFIFYLMMIKKRTMMTFFLRQSEINWVLRNTFDGEAMKIESLELKLFSGLFDVIDNNFFHYLKDNNVRKKMMMRKMWKSI